MNAMEIAKHPLNLHGREDDRQPHRTLRALDAGNPPQFSAEDFLVKKENRALGLILGRRGDAERDRKVGQERFDFNGVQVRRMALVVE